MTTAAVTDFSLYVHEVQQVFKAHYSYDDRTEHDNSIKVNPLVEEIFESIAAEVTQQTPFEAKHQALNATIEIAEWILKDGDCSPLGHDIREDLPHMPLKSTISHILNMLLAEELAALRADGELPRAVRHLRWRAEAYSLDLGIDGSIDRLWLEDSDESDQEEDGPMAL
jgi:hypothetical protein